MKKIILWMGMAIVFLANAGRVEAADYVIEKFEAKIEIKKDRSIEVEETIGSFFEANKHGIIRTIPFAYSPNGVTLTTPIKVMSVTDDKGNRVPFTVSNFKQSKQIKIGDADKTIRGKMVYVLRYTVGEVVQTYDGKPEIYWNVTGHEWDIDILEARVEVVSPWAEVVKSECFSGLTGSTGKNCVSIDGGTVEFATTQAVGMGRDFTIAVGLNPANQLTVLSPIQMGIKKVADNIGYLVALLPLTVMGWMWWKKGRDMKYQGDNVFYKPEKVEETSVSPFQRPHLPTVYGQIEGLTPAEVGAMADERVDLSDIVAEIMELARLGYIKIKKIEKKVLLWKDNDYLLTKINKDETLLTEHQSYLLKSLFSHTLIDKTHPEDKEEKVAISSLKNKFYSHIEPFKKKVFQSLTAKKAIDEDPRTTQGKWIAITMGMSMVVFFGLQRLGESTGNYGPMIGLIAGGVGSVFLALAMPRRTAWGYSLYRQTAGLKYFINKGKWREEIAEKNLFLEEVLPLAIALGVVKKLTAEMAELGVEPPRYFEGSSVAAFSTDLGRFVSSGQVNAAASPSSSGKGSWSGGSGFSGGSSGGGMGGGGGSSW